MKSLLFIAAFAVVASSLPMAQAATASADDSVSPYSSIGRMDNVPKPAPPPKPPSPRPPRPPVW